MNLFRIGSVRIENTASRCITDNPSPVVSFSLESGLPDTFLTSAKVTLGNRCWEGAEQTGIVLENAVTKPFSSYTLQMKATDNHGNTASAVREFYSGRLDTPWEAKWITDGGYEFPKGQSPLPMTFQRRFTCRGTVRRAWVTSTAIGIYELELNGKKVGNEYFAPGYTTYRKNLQYQLYDVTALLEQENKITAYRP